MASDRRSDTPPQRAYLCAPAARKAGTGPACGALAGGVQTAAPRRGKGCSSSPQPGPRLGWGAAPPARGPGPLRPPAGRGRRGGRPHSPHRVGAGPPRSTCAAPGTGEEQCKARRAAPQGLGLALRRGAPVQRLAANLTKAGPTGARPWPPHYPGQPPQGDGRGGRRHAAQGGQGCGPLAAGGGWDGPEGRTGAPTTARRRWPPFPLPAAAASDGGRVWGVTQQQTAAPPLSAAAQGPAWGPLRCGAAADAHGVPGPQSGPRPQLGPVMLMKAGRQLVGWSGAGPRPHLTKSYLSDTFSTVGRQ